MLRFMLMHHAADLWTATAPTTFFGIRLGTRATIVRLPGGELWVHSPIPLLGSLRAEIDALGSVAFVVAPNLYHHLHVAPWLAAWPEAELIAHPRLAKKRPDLRITRALGSPLPFADTLAPVSIDGTMLGETVFVHRPSRTLVSADLIENFASSDHWYTRMYLKLAGLENRAAFSFVLRPTVTDRRAARRSLDALLAFDFDRITLAHGEVIAREGPDALREAYAWL